MLKTHKILIVPAVILLISVIFLTGCPAADTATPVKTTTTIAAQVSSPFTQQELQQIAAASLLASKNAGSLRIKMDLTTKTSIDGGGETGEMGMKALAAFNTEQNQMMMSAEMTQSSGTSTAQTTAFELYVFTDYVYIKANVPNLGDQWIKSTVTAEILETFDANMMQEEMDILQNPASIEFVKYGTTNNIDCYVLKIVPNNDYLRDYAQKQMSDTFEIDWDKIQDISKIYKELSYVVWIAKDSKMLHKMEISAVIELSSEFAKSQDFNFDNTTSEISGSLELYDYNTSVEINLPEEASGAIEVSPDAFSGQ